jgi:glycosyltransferase 2 family protein
VSRHEPFPLDRRRAARTLVVVLLLVVGAVALIGHVANFGTMLDALEQADKPWFGLCLLGELLAYLGYIAAYRDVARVDGGPVFSYWTSTRVVAAGFGAFIAGSSAGTLGLDYWALHRAGERRHDAVRRVLALNTLEWTFLAAFAAATAAYALADDDAGTPLGMELGWLVTVPVCIVAALWVSAPTRADRFTAQPLPAPPNASLPRRFARELRAGLADAIGGVVLVRRVLLQPLRYPAAVFGFAVYWAGDILTLYAALRAFDVHLELVPLVLAYTTAYVVTALPLPFGGAGGIEAGLTLTLTAVGVPLAHALLATLVYRFFTLWLPIVPALLVLPRLRTLADELPAATRAH